MKQKLQDLIAVIQESRKAKFIIACGIVALIFAWWNSGRPGGNIYIPRNPPRPQQKNTITDQESVSDVISRFTNDLQTIKVGLEQTEEELKQQRKIIKDYDESTARIFTSMLGRITEIERQNNQASPGNNTKYIPDNPNEAPPTILEKEDIPNEDPTELTTFGPVDDEPEPTPEPIREKRTAYIGSGDSVRVKLLAGVNAPTDGTPYPAVFKLISEVNGPDGSALPLGEARLIAAAQGSLTDSRALFRLTSMNISMPSGKRVVVPVNGWIAGEDGIQGMPGIAIDPIGRALAGAGMVGAVAGYGQALQLSNTTVTQNPNQNSITSTVTGDTGEFVAGRGLSQAAQEWQRLLRTRLRDLVPVIQIYSGREATAIFANPVKITGLYEELQNEWEYNNEFVNLD